MRDIHRSVADLGLTLLLLLPVSACGTGTAVGGDTLRAQLIGSWQQVSQTRDGQPVYLPPGITPIVTFSANGTFTGSVAVDTQIQSFSGNWTLTGSTLTLSATTGGVSGSNAGTIFISGNTLTFEYNDGDVTVVEVYQRL